MIWPGSASVRVSTVSCSRGPFNGPIVLDSRPVSRIGCNLKSATDVSKAECLDANAGMSYQGANPDSLGFLLTLEEYAALVQRHGPEVRIVRRYITGEDLTSRPDRRGSRWIIDFSGLSEEQARSYPHCFSLVLARVRPGRMRLKRKAYRDRWWQFTEPQIEAHTRARVFTRVLGISRVTKYVAFDWIDPAQVVSAKITMVMKEDDVVFGVLQSSIHEVWAVTRGGRHGVGGSFSYSPVQCFRTFPFPPDAESPTSRLIAQVAERYGKQRSASLIARHVGLTELYNRFHDPDCKEPDLQKLRDLHAEMDKRGPRRLRLDRARPRTRMGQDRDRRREEGQEVRQGQDRRARRMAVHHLRNAPARRCFDAFLS